MKRSPSAGRLTVLALTGLCAAQLSAQALAADATPAATPDWQLTSNLALTNDYIWRGLTQTWGKPALQAGLELAHTSGAYLGLWGSNVSEQWIPGSSLELDAYAGYRGTLPVAEDIGYDLNLIYVYYPGGDYAEALDGKTFKSSKVNTLEASAAVSYRFAKLKYGRTLTRFYGWTTDNSAPGVFSAVAPDAGVTGSTRGSQYAQLDLSQEVAPGWTLSGQIGRQWIAHSTGLNWSYYKLGVDKAFDGGWDVGMAYSWTTKPREFDAYASLTGNGDTIDAARARLLLTVSRSF